MIAGGALALALTVSAQAQTLLTGADKGEILNAARGYGAATLTTQSNGDPQITARSMASPTRSISATAPTTPIAKT